MEPPQIEPGAKLSDREKAALAADNEKISRDAQQAAAEQQERDRHEGHGRPVVQEVAESIERKLRGEEFDKKNR